MDNKKLKSQAEKLSKKVRQMNTPTSPDADKIHAKNVKSRKIDFNSKHVMTFIIVALVLVALVSGFVIKGERDKKTIQPTESQALSSEELENESDTNTRSVAYDGKVKVKNMVFAVSNEKSSDLLMLVFFNFGEKNDIGISFLPLTTELSSNGVKKTLKGHFEKGGINQAIFAINETFGAKIDEYVAVTVDELASILNYIGEFPVNIPHEVSGEYNGINYTIDAGDAQMNPQLAIKYMLYMCENIGFEYENLTTFLSSLATQFFKKGESVGDESVMDFVLKSSVSSIDATEKYELLGFFENYFYGENEVSFFTSFDIFELVKAKEG